MDKEIVGYKFENVEEAKEYIDKAEAEVRGLYVYPKNWDALPPGEDSPMRIGLLERGGRLIFLNTAIREVRDYLDRNFDFKLSSKGRVFENFRD